MQDLRFYQNVQFRLNSFYHIKFFLSYFEKFWFRFDGPKKTLVFCFSFFHFDDFLTTFAKDLIKKPPVFVTNTKSTHNLLHFHKDLRSRNFWQWSDGSLKFCENCTEICFLCKFLPSLGNLRPLFILKYVISTKFYYVFFNKYNK